uniref:Facilitated trehalose transporter Tret1-like isoform X1 n=2 Tax=Diabrotica virgifera virgifera TaxID=50390 RepID=A0A6P7EXC5_DIAVI
MLTSDQTQTSANMELLNKKDYTKKEIITYRFSLNNEKAEPPEVPEMITRIRQVILSICVLLACLPFGLMLGWPSPTNPILINKDSPIPITIDQSAMIAGFLMIGNTVGTPFCRKTFLGTKFSILIGILIMGAGWTLMWQSQNIFWLLGSRLLVGIGNGYCAGQVKIYISNICDEDLKQMFTKLINLYIFLGIIMIYSFGPFIDFRYTSITCMLITLVVFCIILLLPTTPKELVKANKLKQARNIISKLKPGINLNTEVNKISDSLKIDNQEYGFLPLMKDREARINFIKFTLLTFCQQFSGAPATIIYTQILLRESHCSYPKYFAVAYAITFFISNVIGMFLMPRFNKKTVLLLSTFSVILLQITKILLVYFEVNEKYWSYSSTLVLFLFIVVHTLGLGNIPLTLIPDMFSSSYRTFATHFFICFHSMLALIITKIFQVLLTQYHVGVPFYLFLSVSSFAFVFIYFFIGQKTEKSAAVIIVENLDKNNKIVI